MSKKKVKPNEKPRVNQELDGFDMKIDTFGEIKTNFEIERINHFLNTHLEDKKLKHRDDLQDIKNKKYPND